jgi:hypothetical protein
LKVPENFVHDLGLGENGDDFHFRAASRTNQRVKHQVPETTPADSQQTPGSKNPSAEPNASRACWARLLRKVFEVDPLICPRCGAEMKVIAVLTEPKVVDKILRHLQEKADRAPPGDLPRNPP